MTNDRKVLVSMRELLNIDRLSYDLISCPQEDMPEIAEELKKAIDKMVDKKLSDISRRHEYSKRFK